MMARVGFNARFLHAPVTGVERYARNVLPLVLASCAQRGIASRVFIPEHCSVPEDWPKQGVEYIGSALPSTGLGRHLWDQLYLPMQASQIDLLIGLTNTAPLLTSSKNIVTVHDVAWLKNPEWFTPSFNLAYRVFVNNAARGARAIMTVSATAKQEIVNHLGIQPNKIRYCWLGIDASFSQASATEIAECRQKLGLTKPYLLYVGSLQKRKNIDSLIDAHKRLKANSEGAPDFVIAGDTGSQFAATTLGTSDCIRFIGRQDDATVRVLYSGALAGVSASWYESFGLPLVEGMACGTPAIVSDIAAHREVCADAGLYFDPSDIESIVRVLSRFVADEASLPELRRRSLERAKKFTWSAHARAFVQLIEDELNKRN